MTYASQQAQPPLKFIPPALNPWVLTSVQWLLPWWLRWRMGITAVSVEGGEQLVELYRRFQAKQVRFLIAFRHPSTDDPLCLAHLLGHYLPRAATQLSVPLRWPTHAHVLYDRGIPIWAGAKVGWLFSQLGGTPIQRGKLDRVGLRSARDLFMNGEFPMAVAPEGGTNGHNELISPLEPGVAQMGFWCQEDLLKVGRHEEVMILPLGIQYHFQTDPWLALEQWLTHYEQDCGLLDPAQPLPAPSPSAPPPHPATAQTANASISQLYQRLTRLGGHLLQMLENFYQQFYHLTLPDLPMQESTTPNLHLSHRLQRLLDMVLKVAEDYFDLQANGTVIDRCRRIEQAGWERIYREDIADLEALSPLERSLADRIAQEAQLRMWHMRLVESFVAVTGVYVQEKPSAERFADTLLLIGDLMQRIQGSPSVRRPYLGARRVEFRVGDPLSVTERWESYSTNRRAAKEAVALLTRDLQTALQSLIHA
ncbi:MAG: 1-acyl-sn-glycerol-3-phosphate acyltransferase [Cyanobacteriota bacterium]|nr:1-acyl-sn-glycerol-3-phosphate acyltransferase [Cyanobacteriota bacterium]